MCVYTHTKYTIPTDFPQFLSLTHQHQQVWHNCAVYNAEGTLIAVIGRLLDAIFEANVQEVRFVAFIFVSVGGSVASKSTSHEKPTHKFQLAHTIFYLLAAAPALPVGGGAGPAGAAHRGHARGGRAGV